MLLLLAVILHLSCAGLLPVKGGGGVSDTSVMQFFFFPSCLSQVKLDPEQPLHLSTGHTAKPISSCISLIRDFNMCHPPGGVGGGLEGAPWHAHNRHTENTPPCLDSLLQLPALPVSWPASLLRADHM